MPVCAFNRKFVRRDFVAREGIGVMHFARCSRTSYLYRLSAILPPVADLYYCCTAVAVLSRTSVSMLP